MLASGHCFPGWGGVGWGLQSPQASLQNAWSYQVENFRPLMHDNCSQGGGFFCKVRSGHQNRSHDMTPEKFKLCHSLNFFQFSSNFQDGRRLVVPRPIEDPLSPVWLNSTKLGGRLSAVVMVLGLKRMSLFYRGLVEMILFYR